MQIIKTAVNFFFFLLPAGVFAQSTYLQQGAREVQLMDRLETLSGDLFSGTFTGIKPFSRKNMVQEARRADSLLGSQGRLTRTDRYELQTLYMNNSEWYVGDSSSFASRKPFLTHFYRNKAHLWELNHKDAYLAVDPLLHLRAARETGQDDLVFLNARGLTLRGLIAGRVGFSTSIVENQERGPLYYQQQVSTYRAVPGVGFYKVYKKDLTAQDYFDARGSVSFRAAKFMDMQFGFDKQFIGNGYRSLMLSDWGNSYLFFKINTRFWKINYQNLFMELIPQFTKTTDSLYSRKYAAMHHLSINVTRWLNLGLFEGVVFGRKNHFDFQYLNPIIFYRHIEGGIGSPDNVLAGFDYKALVARRIQLYGQLMLDEFIISRLRSQPSNWANKFAIQLGAKYPNAFGVKDLDLQVEMNRVRPFMYSHYDTVNNYTHYNQPLAHPLGANFQEWVAIARYRPHPQWQLSGRMIYYNKGLDTANANFGGNIFRNYNTRLTENGFRVGSGDRFQCLNTLMVVSYEWKTNLFFEATWQWRNSQDAASGVKESRHLLGLGLRMNLFRREYDF